METTTNGTALQATPPDQYPGWQPPRPHTLPSGAVFVLQKPQIRKMIRRGQIPNPLMNIINEVFKERDELDINYIMEFANGDHDQIAPFPPDAERPDRGGDGSEVLDETEPVAGHPA
jgi:hypothetical protein